MRRESVLFLIIIATVAKVRGSSIGLEKHWLPDLEWQTVSNWADGFLPDAKSQVVFPEKTHHTVGLPDTGTVEVAEIVLPREGSLSLGRNGMLKFSKEKKPKKTIKWAKEGRYLWIDPENWDGYVNATPHVERIPCERDTVVLPRKNRTLSLTLPNVDTHVAGVRITGENTTLNSWEWDRLTDQSREFQKNRLTVTYVKGLQKLLCDDCKCHGNVDPELADEVCRYMYESDKCGPALCEYPLKVEGHCCDYCGGRVGLSSKASLWKVKRRVDEALENYHGFVTWHVRRTWDGKTEVLIAENGPYEGINSKEAVDDLAKLLMADGYEVLENVATGSALTGSALFISIIPMFVIPVILILLIIAAIPYFGHSYSQVYSELRVAVTSREEGGRPAAKPKSGGYSFGFARFKNESEGDVTLEEAEEVPVEETAAEDSDANGASSSSRRFVNPLYKSKRDENKKSKTADKAEEKMINIDEPVSLVSLESRIKEHGIEEVYLD